MTSYVLCADALEFGPDRLWHLKPGVDPNSECPGCWECANPTEERDDGVCPECGEGDRHLCRPEDDT